MMNKNSRKNGKTRQGNAIAGDKASDLYAYVIKGGKAKVFESIKGKQLLIGTLGKGEVFGEMAFFGETMKTVSVIADGKSKVEMITKNTFMDSLNMLPLDARNKMHVIISDLAMIADINRRLATLFQNIRHTKTTTVDTEILKTEFNKVPEGVRPILDAIINRLRAETIKFNKLTNQAMPP